MGDGRGRGEREEGEEGRGEEGGEGRVEGMDGLGEACAGELETACETRGGRNTLEGSKTDFSTWLQTPEVGFHFQPTRAHLMGKMLWILLFFNYHLRYFFSKMITWSNPLITRREHATI